MYSAARASSSRRNREQLSSRSSRAADAVVLLQTVQTARAKLHDGTSLRREIEDEIAELQGQPQAKGAVAEHGRKKRLARLQALLKQQEPAAPRRPRAETTWSRSLQLEPQQQPRAWRKLRQSVRASAGFRSTSAKRASSDAVLRNGPLELGQAVQQRRSRQSSQRQADLLHWCSDCEGAALRGALLPSPPQRPPIVDIPPLPRAHLPELGLSWAQAKGLQERTVDVELELAIELPKDDAALQELAREFRTELVAALEIDAEQVAQVTICTKAHRLCNCRLCS